MVIVDKIVVEEVSVVVVVLVFDVDGDVFLYSWIVLVGLMLVGLGVDVSL